VTLPGPSGVAWALGLLLWAAAAAVVGEIVRALGARRVRAWRRLEVVERVLLDFYLGGATMYLIAALPLGAFSAPVVLGIPVAAGVGLLALVFLGRHAGRPGDGVGPLAALVRPAAVVALLSALGLFIVEVAVALPIATGNTYDSSVLTLYVSLLIQHHSIALSLRPYAPWGVFTPQGPAVWLGWAQLDFGLPPARTSVLVTPLFLALAPLGAFVFGRRAFDSDWAGLAFAVMLATVASWTRALVGGSNDFVFAFPLVLLLAGQSFAWLRASAPSIPDVLAFGVLIGYSAALNPVGAEWLLPSLLIAGLILRPSSRGGALRWIGSWAAMVAASLVALIPSIYVALQGGEGPGGTGLSHGAAAGISEAQFVGSIDPYLFRPGDVSLSPLPLLRAELAILLTVGLLILLLVGRRSHLGQYIDAFRVFMLAGLATTIGLLALLRAASTGFGPAVVFSEVTAYSELSATLFTLYAFIGGLLLVLLFERLAVLFRSRPAENFAPSDQAPRRRLASGVPPTAVVVLLALVLVVPGVALTPTQLPPVLTQIYQDFGNVSAGDFALLSYASSHLPSGARVLVAPGSAAEFLPGYAMHIVLLYPMVRGAFGFNTSYTIIVRELTNSTLNATGMAALASLDVGYIAVTGANTVLWPPFSPAPLLADPSGFPLVFQDGDAYLFECSTQS
jgi:hypothetical protein